MPRKHQLECCALCQMTAEDFTSLTEIRDFVAKVKKDSLKVWNRLNRDSGERAIFCIATPAETMLKKNLVKAGFRPIANFDRRNGYEKTGLLTMYFINF